MKANKNDFKNSMWKFDKLNPKKNQKMSGRCKLEEWEVNVILDTVEQNTRKSFKTK